MTWKKVDANQPQVVDELRGLGLSVQPLSSLGKGVPDLLIGVAKVNFLVEVKADASKTLTTDQIEWHCDWQGNIIVGYDTVQIIKAILDYLKLFRMETHPDFRYLQDWVYEKQITQKRRDDWNGI